jgi:hypothetical protein
VRCVDLCYPTILQMPRRCVVPGCKSNYDSTLKQNNSVTTFAFPKDEKKKQAWMRAIPRADWSPTAHSAVCIKHFHESHIIKHQPYKNPTSGEIQKLLLQHPKLTEDAIPKVFDNLPAYLSKKEPPARTSPDCRREQVLKRNAVKIEEFLKEDIISDFDSFVSCFLKRLKVIDKWHHNISDRCVWFYSLNVDSVQNNDVKEDQLKVVCSISVSNEMVVKVSLNQIEIPKHDLEWILPSDSKLSRWSQIENLLIRYKNVNEINNREQNYFEYYIDKACKFVKKSIEFIEEDVFSKHKDLLELIENQLKLLLHQRKSYNSLTITFAFMIFSQSPAVYNFIREYLILPHKRYLQSISAAFHVDPNLNANTKHYLSHISKSLTNRELNVSLLLDEIYINKCLTFKAQKIVGCAENNPTELAKTVQSFMISSCFGHFKEIVKLVPVSGLTGEQLKHLVLTVIHFVQQFNFKVTVVISDNNRINQLMFRLFAPVNYFIENPNFNNLKVFLTYDFVHIFKNIRNNWINLKNHWSTFLYPDFNDLSIIKKASFHHLRVINDNEKDLLIKKAFKLNNKTLYPSNIERQNVTLVDNVFHRSTIAALKEIEDYAETADFVEIIRNWWDIVNSKSVIAGKIKKNEYSGPIHDLNDPKLQYLRQFVLWIREWRLLTESNVGVGLTKDTSAAIERSTTVLVDLVLYSFQQLGVSYVLGGKFQTDNLEKRFGQYRRLSGCNYNVSFQQILESEKKLRVKKILDLARTGTLSIKDISDSSQNVSEENLAANINEFNYIFDGNYLEVCALDQGSTLYVCGYASFSVCKRLSCSFCKDLIRESKGDDISDTYFDSLQRGGLSLPTESVISIFFHMHAIFDFIINDSMLENKFLHSPDQTKIIMTLTNTSLEKCNFFDELECMCGETLKNIVPLFYSVFSNILLNNYTKTKLMLQERNIQSPWKTK